MKKITIYLMAACMSLTFFPVQTNAAVVTADNTSLTDPGTAKSASIMLRLNEIKKLAKSNLSSSEKKALKTELMSLKKEAKAESRGVYLSIGAVIIIILLLILIL